MSSDTILSMSDPELKSSFFKTSYIREGVNNNCACYPAVYPLSKYSRLNTTMNDTSITNNLRYSQLVNSSCSTVYTYSGLVAKFGTTIPTNPPTSRRTSGLGGPTFSY